MPVTAIIELAERLTITRCEGVVTDEDFLEARADLLANPRFDPTFDRIWDFHAVTESRVSPEAATRLAGASPISEKAICRAVVMSERSAPLKTILDFIELIRQNHRSIAVFPDTQSARQWISATRVALPPD